MYRIAIWWWETDVIPDYWKQASKSIDELWAGSSFIVESLRRTFDVPVRHIPLGFELGPLRQVNLATYGVPAGSFVFLFIFDLNSTLARKNPLGLISAFKQAFQSGEKVSLVIKVSRGASHPVEFHRLQKEAKQVGAVVIDQWLAQEELFGLIAACDCYISLHRSEGLGATLAEAMMLGKPCIATKYSGNLDFMDDNNSLLIDYQLTEIEETVGPYDKGHRWAEPSIPQAANAMRWVFEQPEEARLLGKRRAFQHFNLSRGSNVAAGCSSGSIRFEASEAEGETIGNYLRLTCKLAIACGAQIVGWAICPLLSPGRSG